MPLFILGKDVANYAKIDPTLDALRGSPRPMESGKGWFSLGVQTGNLTGVAANAPVFSFQNMNDNLIAIRRVQVCFTLTTAFGAAQYLDFGLIASRGITVYTSGGTNILASGGGNNMKLFAEGMGCTAINAKVATTGTLTVGTRTLDSNYMGMCGAWMGAIGANIPLQNLLDQGPGEHPLILAKGEGVEIAPVTAMGATGVGKLGINIEWCEIPAANF